MSRRSNRLTQDPRVMVAVLALLTIVVLTRLGDILPEKGPEAAIASTGAELSPPSDLRQVARASRVYLGADAGDGTKPPTMIRSAGAGGARNPFEFSRVAGSAVVEPVTEEVQTAKLDCKAIFSIRGVRSALLGHSIVVTGDLIEEFTVERIAEDGVLLLDDETELWLPLHGDRNPDSPNGLAITKNQRGH